MKQNLPERRRFIRIDVPLKLVVESAGIRDEAVTVNISPVGLRIEISRELDPKEKLSISLFLPKNDVPVQLAGRVVWQSRKSLEDNAPYNVGVEIMHIEDKSKNIFLQYLCDLLYDSTYEVRT